MLCLTKPSYSRLRDYLWTQRDEPFTYDEVGATKSSQLPMGYTIGQRRVLLGTGTGCFRNAKDALRQWKMFPPEFVDLVWPGAIEKNRVVATLFRAPGFWVINPCRIVYTVDEVQPHPSGDEIERFGFAYGTVGQHLASGEERFFVEYNHRDESVWYEVICFSKVNHWLSLLAYPYLRIQQYRFRLLSAKAMKQAVHQVESLNRVAVCYVRRAAGENLPERRRAGRNRSHGEFPCATRMIDATMARKARSGEPTLTCND